MRNAIVLASLFCMGLACDAHAEDSELDRLREALRQSMVQSRTLQDQQAALQTKLNTTERDNTALKAQVAAAKAKVKQVEKDYRQAVKEFNERLEERNQALEKWKDAYAEAANVARSKEADRAKLEADGNTLKGNLKVCTDKNRELVKVGLSLIGAYRSVTLGDVLLARDPVTGLKRAQIENRIEDYKSQLDTQSVQDQDAQH